MKASPTIAPKEFARRRVDLMAMMAPDSIAILPSASVVARNSDIDYPFRQDSDFQYLSGFGEPDAVLVLVPGRAHGETILFCRECDPDLELRLRMNRSWSPLHKNRSSKFHLQWLPSHHNHMLSRLYNRHKLSTRKYHSH